MYQNEPNEIEFVRNTILVNQFYKIVTLCGDECPIVPLKGMSLLFSIYKDNYARNVADIDFLVTEENVPNIVEKLESIGYHFRKNHEKLNVRLSTKHKFDMINLDNRFCDLDIHINLINKKWFKLSTGDFNSFALSRIKTIEYKNLNINILSEIDEWLYLAQHYCFHLFSNDKWFKDLYLIQKKFSNADIIELTTTAHHFHFERIVTAVSRRLKDNYQQDEIKIPEMLTKKRLIFDSISSKNLKYAHKFSNRIIAIYWEFIFIHSCKSRISAYLHLLFPRMCILMDIYNCKPMTSLLLYPLHIILVLLSSILFICIYLSSVYSIF